MKKRAARKEQIQQFILQNVTDHPKSVSKMVAAAFSISRVAANAHIRTLVDEGLLGYEGTTSDRSYYLKQTNNVERTFSYDLTSSLNEDVIWITDLKPLLQNLPVNVINMWSYCTTEIINNAIDHSGGTQLEIYFSRSADKVKIWVNDNGEGIFKKIQRSLGLVDERQALFELKKGKLTTDKTRHSGQRIFFSARMCDDFTILSGTLAFLHTDQKTEDWLSKKPNVTQGTAVCMEMENHTQRTAKEIHDQYSSDDDSYQFAKTVVPVRLVAENEGLVSRSQAKRLLLRVDNFQTVILNFEGVEEIGQGFADEIFRVFARQHPDVNLYPLNTNEAVSNMISRALLTHDEL